MRTHPFRSVIILLLAAAGFAGAAVPALVNYQGRLTDANDVPVTGPVVFAVALHGQAVGGDPLYTESVGSVSLTDNGVYSFSFGSAPGFATALGSGEVWLEVSADGVALSPRERVLAVPYALVAGGVTPGAVDAAALASPYRTGEITIHTLETPGATFDVSPRVIDLPINFPQAYSVPPFFSANAVMVEPFATLDTGVATMEIGPGGASVRMSLNHVHQGTGLVTGRHGAALVDGVPAAAGRVGNDLSYVRAADPKGLEWPAPVAVGPSPVAPGVAFAVIDGRPGIAYTPSNSNTLLFVRANDPLGQTWGTPQVVHSVSSGNISGLHLADVNGRPAVAFQVSTFDGILIQVSDTGHYVVAQNTAGTSWGAPFTIAQSISPGGVGSSYRPKILMADTLPAVVYQSIFAISYRRATNIFGTSWGNPVSVVSHPHEQIEWSFDAAIIRDRPMIVFHDDSSDTLRQIRATNAAGSAWPGSSGSIRSGVTSMGFVSLAEINGRAAIVYSNDGALTYKRALNDASNSWPFSGPNLTHPNHPLGPTALIEADGEPAILYSDRFLRSGQLPVGSLRWFSVGPGQ